MIRLSRIAELCGGTVRGDDAEINEEAFIDSRAVVPNGLFCAFRGENVDGHDHVAAALAAGAGAALIDNPDAVGDAAPLVIVPNVQDAMGRLAAAHIEGLRAGLTVVAITGSVGKTTTKDLIGAVLPGPTVATRSSLNNEIGLPLTALRATPETRYLVLEMGADKLGDIDYLTSLVAPDVAVVLAVARAHLGVFGGIELVARAKSEIIRGLRPGGTSVLNADDPRVAAMAELAPGPVVWFGREPGEGDVTVAASDVEIDPLGRPTFTLRTPSGSARVHLGLVGEHHVSNALAAAAVATALGVPCDEVARELSGRAASSPHRMAVTTRDDDVTVIDDAYNANPDSMAAALRALRQLGAGRRTVAVIGAMLELGEAEAEEHAALGALIRELNIDRLITIGPLAAIAADQVPARAIRCADLDAARTALAETVQPGDVVLFKASNGSRVWQLADEWAGSR